jgi:TPP-dependent indolepyruvate ferredoxin oxidoreductase alpha subunit
VSANPNIVWIDPDVCEKCMICVEVFGCPAIQRGTATAPGQPGIVPWIHAELCNGNGSCIQVCPLGAIKRPSAARFGGAESGGAGYKGGPTLGSKTDFAGPDSEVCK